MGRFSWQVRVGTFDGPEIAKDYRHPHPVYEPTEKGSPISIQGEIYRILEWRQDAEEFASAANVLVVVRAD